MRKYPLLLLLILLCFCTGSALAADTVVEPSKSQTDAEPLTFAVIHPGQPGSTQDAQPVMNQLAEYLSSKLGRKVFGAYYNDHDEAMGALEAKLPDFAILSIGFYIDCGEDMTPIASTRPNGRASETWRLYVPNAATDDWQMLTGTVSGTMLSESNAAACLLFKSTPEKLPFSLKGTNRPLRAVRSTVKGKTAGVVLDTLQFESLAALPQASELKNILETQPLPTSPVVIFGDTPELAKRLAGILTDMSSDPKAAPILTILQTKGFGPVDPNLETLRKSCAR